jgi:hypothetical protein
MIRQLSTIFIRALAKILRHGTLCRESQAFFSARRAQPPLALARRLRASLGPQALLRPHRFPNSAAAQHGRLDCLSHFAAGPNPARSRSATPRLARPAGAAETTPVSNSATQPTTAVLPVFPVHQSPSTTGLSFAHTSFHLSRQPSTGLKDPSAKRRTASPDPPKESPELLVLFEHASITGCRAAIIDSMPLTAELDPIAWCTDESVPNSEQISRSGTNSLYRVTNNPRPRTSHDPDRGNATSLTNTDN